MTKLFSISILIFISLSANATEFQRDVNIIGIVSYADNRPHRPITSNIIRIVVDEQSWGTESSCRNNAADLQSTDSHMLSMLLSAWAMGKSIRLKVDDTLRPIDTVCQVTEMYVQ